jgi:two-component system, chemotaxis family, protein-glutamate methylesterase/glutaminase
VIKVLVVDDSALMRRLLSNVLRLQDDFEVEVARDGVEGLAKLHAFQPDVVTLDIHMPNMDGLACLDRMMIERPCRVIMVSSLTAEGADETFEAMQLGAIDFIAKPSGAISLAIDDLAPVLIEKVRAAARMRIRTTRGLTERVRLRAAQSAGLAGAAANRPQVFSPAAVTPELRAGPSDSVVLVGASTGGPPALDALLSPLPATFPWPILIAQHMPASFTGPLARRLDRLCALSVEEVVRPSPLVPGRVYVGKGDADIIVVKRGDTAFVTAAPSLAEHRWHPSVDRMVRTAIQILGAERLIGVLLTGMGDDGAAAMTQLRSAGGRTIAESEETAIVWGMPGELVKAGGAEVVAPLGKIATCLSGWAR